VRKNGLEEMEVRAILGGLGCEVFTFADCFERGVGSDVNTVIISGRGELGRVLTDVETKCEGAQIIDDLCRW
jgi:hypothetical protein